MGTSYRRAVDRSVIDFLFTLASAASCDGKSRPVFMFNRKTSVFRRSDSKNDFIAVIGHASCDSIGSGIIIHTFLNIVDSYGNFTVRFRNRRRRRLFPIIQCHTGRAHNSPYEPCLRNGIPTRTCQNRRKRFRALRELRCIDQQGKGNHFHFYRLGRSIASLIPYRNRNILIPNRTSYIGRRCHCDSTFTDRLIIGNNQRLFHSLFHFIRRRTYHHLRFGISKIRSLCILPLCFQQQGC